MKRIVILGGGFGGVYTALKLEKLLKKHRDSVEIVLVSRQNYLTYQPMLAEVVGGSIDILDSVTCLRSLLKHTSIYIREVTEINLEKEEITLSPNFSHKDVVLHYDHLVLGLGSVTDFRTSPGGLAEHALPFKDLADAVALRNRIIDVIETAAQEPDPAEQKALLTFVVGGGGFSGVEVVAEINDLAKKKVRSYKTINKDDVRVILVHAKDRLVDRELSPSLGRYCGKVLTKRGIDIRFNSKLSSATPKEAILESGEKIRTRTVVSTVPSISNPLIDSINLEKEFGRVKCNSDLTALNKKNIWAIGDCSLIPKSPKTPESYSPPTAQFATRQADTLAHNLKAAILGGKLKEFKFKSLGQMAALGHKRAVAEIFGIKLSGVIAWILWRFVYLMKIPGFGAKIRISFSWFIQNLLPSETVQLKSKPKKSFDSLHFADGDIIFNDGDVGDYLYVLVHGCVEVIKNNKVVSTLEEGQYFGEMALLSQKKRSATIKAKGPCKILAIQKDDFQVLIDNFHELKQDFINTKHARLQTPRKRAQGE